MTLHFQGYDQSQECKDFIQKVKLAQGWMNGRYSKQSKATIELTAFVPEQPELLASHGLSTSNHNRNI